MRFPIPISPSYCAHWGLWEAVREIYQNALDEGNAAFEYHEDLQRLDISSATGRLTTQSLLLGTTTKQGDASKRGKFGEGYKIALLVLARLGHKVVIHNNDEIWIARILQNDLFNTAMLTVDTISARVKDGVHFYIYGVTTENISSIRRNIRPDTSHDQILFDPQEQGRIYVGDLYVSTIPNYRCGYSFRPDVVKLDRDRGMIAGFDLAWQTSKLWTSKGHCTQLSELMEAESPEVEYVEEHSTSHPTFSESHHSYFVARHGVTAVPVSTQQEIQKATAAGMKWILVPEKVKAILRRVGSWFIPSHETPYQRLTTFLDMHGWRLPESGKEELQEIIKLLEPK